MREYVKKICPEFDKIIEAEIFSKHGESIGWHSSAVGLDQLPISSGSSHNKILARRIAIAELCERSLVSEIFKGPERDVFLCKEFPSTSGFAFGFDQAQTKLRSIAEACERWVWSKWIDEGFILDEINIQHRDLTKLAQFYLDDFENVKFYKKNINVFIDSKILQFEV